MKKFRLLFAALPLLLMSFSFTGDQIRPGKWKFIADKNVRYGPDHDVIIVTGNDNYSQLRLKVTDAPLKVNDMKVHFENGGVFDVSIRREIAKGGQSRVIDLPAGSRSIKKVEFWYSTIGTQQGTSRVALWGKR
jgi:hypothetical protein